MDLARGDGSRECNPSRSGGSDRRLDLALVKRIVFEEVWYWYEAILGVVPGRLGRLLRIFAYWPILPAAVNIGEVQPYPKSFTVTGGQARGHRTRLQNYVYWGPHDRQRRYSRAERHHRYE